MIRLYHGKDPFLSLREAKSNIDMLVDKAPGIDVKVLDCDQCTAENIVNSYRMDNMFESTSILFFKRLSGNKAKDLLLEDLIEYISNNNSDSKKIFLWEDHKIASNTKYLKQLSQLGEVYESPDLNKRTFMTWAQEEIKKNGINIDKSYVYKLAERSDYITERFAKEIEKLLLTETQSLNPDEIDKMFTNTFEYDIWALIDKINSTEIEQQRESLMILDKLLQANNDPYYILSMLYRNARLITMIKYLQDNNTAPKEICATLKIPPFTLPSLAKKAEMYDWNKLLTIYEKLNNLDFEVKIGNLEPSLGITLLLGIM